MKDPRDIFRQFSPQAKKILTTAQQVAESMNTGIGSEHILIALTVTPQTVAHELLKEYTITLEQIRLVLSLNNLWNKSESGMTDEAKTVITTAIRTAARLTHERVEPEHLLLAVTSMRDARAYQVIARVGVDPNHLGKQLEGILAATSDLRMVIDPELAGEHHHHDDDGAADVGADQPPTWHDAQPTNTRTVSEGPPKKKLLEVFTTDLTKLAEMGKLDPLIGRESELERTVQVLARRTKNNPVLIGEPGVGKTAIVEGLAHRIVSGDVPSVLTGRRILRLDLALLVAGTMYRGQFEERLKKLIEEIMNEPNTIVFIDELHTVVGTGSAEGSMDTANILKPNLARGELRLIGATTLDEYRRFIERDPALERRFQTILVSEPTPEATIAILTGLATVYEDFHEVKFDDDALEAAVILSKRYISDRSLPDKAIDLLDEAAAAKRIREPSGLSIKIQGLKKRLDGVRKLKEREIDREEFSRAAKLRDKELSIQKLLLDHEEKDKTTKRPRVTKEDIATVVAQWTGIPKSHLVREAAVRIQHLEERINEHLIGQGEAVKRVVKTLKRAHAGINQPGRPLGSFLFLGPTGVGKTELARILAREMFGDQDAFIKIDMSEFMERHAVARLVGAPAGYVGYEEGGKLTEAVRRRPYALLLLDEIEKAHPEVQNILLQILEDGTLTDAKGRKVNFANTIIVMTSNLGTHELNQAQAIGFHVPSNKERELTDNEYTKLSEKVMASVRDYFQPEFLNRLDSTLVFRALDPEAIGKIVDLRVNELVRHLAQAGYTLTVTPKARRMIAEHGFDAEYGARPIRRLITDWIEDPVAHLIVEEQLQAGQTVIAEADKKQAELRLSVQPSQPSKTNDVTK